MSEEYEGTQVGGGDTLYRLRRGIERRIMADINSAAGDSATSQIPIMWDHLTTKISAIPHVPSGMNALYLDGHVEFHHYPGARFPATKLCAFTFGRYNWLFDGLE